MKDARFEVERSRLRPRLRKYWAFSALLSAGMVVLPACSARHVNASAADEIAQGTELSLRYGFELAAPHFARARAVAAPGSTLWLQATLGLAVALHHQVPLNAERIEQQAAPLYEEVFARGGHSLLAARAALNRGRAAEERDEKDEPSDIVKARTWYAKVIAGWPGEAVAGEATLRLAESYLETLQPDQVKQGIALSEARARAFPSEPWASSLWQQAGNAWWILLHDRSNAVRCLLQAEASGLPDPAKSWITIWRIAMLADEAGMRDVAVTHFSRIITEHAASGKAWEAQERLRSLGVPPPLLEPPLELGRAEGSHE